MSDIDDLMKQADAWLAPLAGDDGPCGPDLEYDNAYLELTKAAEGKPETQFEKGSPPEWRSVLGKIDAIFERTRDLRVAVLWLRAVQATQGFKAVPAGLKLICGLLETHWEGLHPRPDPADMDCYARANALAILPSLEGFLGEALNARLAAVKGVGDLRLRDVEVAFSNLAARKGETAFSREQIDQMLAVADKDGADVRVTLVACQQELKRLSGLMDTRLGSGSGSDLKPLADVIGRALSLTHEPEAVAAEDDGATDAGATGAEGSSSAKSRGGLSGSVSTRAEAIRAIDMICDYLDRSEPTNPAPLFLRRARGLLERNFLELLKELAPAALQDVARSVGVDPATVGPQTPAPPAPAKK